MAKKMKKAILDKRCFKEALALRNTSIRKIGDDCKLGWSAKSIQRGVSSGEISPELLDTLGQYLDVDPDYLSGKFHREAEKIDDPLICECLKKSLHPSNHPYLHEQQRMKDDEKFLYEKYFEYLLIIHGISLKQFEALPQEIQGKLSMELEDKIVKILLSYFPQNAAGEES